MKEFNSAEVIKKHMIEKDGILLSKKRMVAELDYAPCLDRCSPLSYSIGQHVPWKLAPHRGVETHNRACQVNLFGLVKLFNVDEYQVQEDLDELQKKIDQVRGRTDQDKTDRQEEVHPTRKKTTVMKT